MRSAAPVLSAVADHVVHDHGRHDRVRAPDKTNRSAHHDPAGLLGKLELEGVLYLDLGQ